MFRWVSTLSMFELTISSWESVRPCGHIHPGGLKPPGSTYIPSTNPERKLRSKKLQLLPKKINQKIHEGWIFRKLPPWNEQQKTTCKWGGRKWSSSKHPFSERFVGFREGIQNQKNPQNQTKNKIMGFYQHRPQIVKTNFWYVCIIREIRFQFPTLPQRCWPLAHRRCPPWRSHHRPAMFADFQAPKKPTFQPLCFQMGVEPKIGVPKMDGENNGKPYEQMDDLGGNPLFLETSKWINSQSLSRDRFLSSKLDAFFVKRILFFTKTPKSPSTQLPLVVIVGQSYPIVGEWVGIVGDPPTGPFHLLPIDCIDTSTVHRHGHGHWHWHTCTYIYRYIGIPYACTYTFIYTYAFTYNYIKYTYTHIYTYTCTYTYTDIYM